MVFVITILMESPSPAPYPTTSPKRTHTSTILLTHTISAKIARKMMSPPECQLTNLGSPEPVKIYSRFPVKVSLYRWPSEFTSSYSKTIILD